MANETKLTISLTNKNGELTSSFTPGVASIDQAAQGAFAPVVIVSTSEEDLVVGDISTEGIIVGKNLDLTNFVTVGPSTGGPLHAFMKIKPTEPFAFRLSPGITWRWVADTAPVKVQIQLYED